MEVKVVVVALVVEVKVDLGVTIEAIEQQGWTVVLMVALAMVITVVTIVALPVEDAIFLLDHCKCNCLKVHVSQYFDTKYTCFVLVS